MVTAAYMRTLFDYGTWATARLLDAAEGLSPAELGRELLAGLPPILPTLTHTLAAEVIWRKRWEGESPTALLAAAEVPTLAALRERWRAEGAALAGRLAALSDEALAETISYTDTKGRPHSAPLWQVLVQVANHGSCHRAEVAAMLTALGRSPGDLDMIFYFRRAR